MGYDWAKDCEHVAFGMVSYEGQSLSTREGHIVYLEDLLNTAQSKRRREIIEEKSPNLENKDEVARQVGVGAVVFFDLYNNRIKDIDFCWDRALNFDGETGPLRAVHARTLLLRAAQGGGAEPARSGLQRLAGRRSAGLSAEAGTFPGRHQGSRGQVRALDDFCAP